MRDESQTTAVAPLAVAAAATLRAVDELARSSIASSASLASTASTSPLLTTSTATTISPYFDSTGAATFFQSTVGSPPLVANRQRSSTKEKKRRRVNANTDNTLDGLVAKKAEVEIHDDDASIRRFLSEQETIELPDDTEDVKRLETDPDVATRQCSTCGYKGKWISEMIRHKRVHTSDRPFKCKFCDRTSKWKADLIRHVAKTHGIRVVSKYSRSKAYDVHQELELRSGADENNNTIGVHDRAPLDCTQCGSSFVSVQQASAHCEQTAACGPQHVRVHFALAATRAASPSPAAAAALTIEQLPPLPRPMPMHAANGLLTMLASRRDPIGAVDTSPPLSVHSADDIASASSSSSAANGDELDVTTITTPNSITYSCVDCPYRTTVVDRLSAHRLGHHHETTDSRPFKCIVCNWRAIKRSTLARHLQLHTEMAAGGSRVVAQMSRQTPAAASAAIGAAAPPMAASLVAALAAHRPPPPPSGGAMLAAVAPPPLLAAAPAASTAGDALGLLSALCGGGAIVPPPLASSPAIALPSLLASTAVVAPALPDMSDAIKELTANPLLTLSLCNLLGQLGAPPSASLAATLGAL